ncbi:hypothetical protein V8E53_008118 [Lactarius tabidus]
MYEGNVDVTVIYNQFLFPGYNGSQAAATIDGYLFDFGPDDMGQRRTNLSFHAVVHESAVNPALSPKLSSPAAEAGRGLEGLASAARGSEAGSFAEAALFAPNVWLGSLLKGRQQCLLLAGQVAWWPKDRQT